MKYHPDTDLYVVETDNKAWLGSLKVKGQQVTVMTHLAGRPPVLHLDDIVQITSAERHPDVLSL